MLMWVPQLAMHGHKLWRVLVLQGASSSPVSVVLKDPVINGAYAPDIRDFRLNRFLEQAGILAPPPPAPSTKPAAIVDNLESAAESASTVAETVSGAVDGAAADAAQQGGEPYGSSGVVQQEPSELQPAGLPPKPDQPQQQTNADERARDTKHISGQQQHSKQQRSGKQQQTDEGSLHVLADASSHVRLWAEVLKPELTVHVLDGKLRVSNEIRDILGSQLVIKGTFGDKFLSQQHEQQQQQQQQQERPPLTAQQPHEHASHQHISVLSSLLQVHFTQPHMEPPPPQLPDTSPGGIACSADNASSRERGLEETGDKCSTLWWRSDPMSQDACVKLSEAVRACGSEQCIPGEWQVMAPNLRMQARVWEVNGFRTLPLKQRILMEGHHGSQQRQAEQQQQQQQQQQHQHQQQQQQTQQIGSQQGQPQQSGVQQQRQPMDSQGEQPPQRAQQQQAEHHQQQQQQQQQQQPTEGQVAHKSKESPSISSLPPKFTLFHEPAALSVRFTNALARYASIPAMA
ncbi:hypothetical protein DUNSADRAFT_13794 [Dunaliella salina]|uniref:Uncharacterized protein n=1 Tax=Dunaliella salina TaxID=3046 RepID=A0ABQ7G8M6_DUNSA|nr:hypothetical protein DUNSADRAFT_13794 [Dunaliella salina]|eukprot:KAF5830963.1 hypothetical protein DUNSADRAFT_13794 [Dunaliella salina]